MESNTKINYKDRIEVESLAIYGAVSLKAGKATDDECSLCRQNLLAPSVDDLQKGNLKVFVTVGACGHAFHKTCIDAHSQKDNYSCPIDKTPWNIAKIIPHTDYINKRNKDDTDIALPQTN